MSKALPGSHFCERHQGNHSHYAPHNCELCVALTERDRLRAQLPDEMQNCTIVFKECERGHGTLTATNWVQHECQQCRIDRLRAEVAYWRNSEADARALRAGADAACEFVAGERDRFRAALEECKRRFSRIGASTHEIDAALKEKKDELR